VEQFEVHPMTDDVIELLMREHHLCGRLLDGLELLVERERAPDEADRALVRELLQFFERGVEGLHQDKEDRVLFARLLTRSAQSRVPFVCHFSAHHRRDRGLLAELGSRLTSFGQWDRPDDPFVTHARIYVCLQRRHLREENERLFPIVRRALRPEDGRVVRAGFGRLEQAHGLAFEPEALQLLAHLTHHLGQLPPSPETAALGDGVPEALRPAQ
jgi:hemerythrin-like domain-containing protein